MNGDRLETELLKRLDIAADTPVVAEDWEAIYFADEQDEEPIR